MDTSVTKVNAADNATTIPEEAEGVVYGDLKWKILTHVEINELVKRSLPLYGT
ncbi:MAG: hypothetical protein ACLTS6_12180 [Anaerobutyricum sp.]